MNTTAVKNSGTSLFELAVDAVVNDDIVALKNLLSTDDELIRAGSWREHSTMLSHNVSANGVEAFRQETPNDAIEVAKILLSRGAANVILRSMSSLRSLSSGA